MKQKISILGTGESGMGAAKLAQKQGYVVFVSDASPIKEENKQLLKQLNIEFEEVGHTDRVLAADIIIKSPGISPEVAIVQSAIKKGIAVIDEIEFAAKFSKAKFIAITGTNGKTTTTLLTYHLLKNAGMKVAMAGNVGHSLAAQLVDQDFDWVVLELSSFQIDGLVDFKPHIAIILNITPDHLDRYHHDVQEYAASKIALLKNMDEGDFFIYYLGSEILRDQVNESTIAPTKLRISHFHSTAVEFTIREDRLIFHEYAFEIPTADLPVKGNHNRINMASAIMSAVKAGVPQSKIVDGLKTFKNAPHRLELVAEINGVRFINDSKATNVDAVYYALETYKEPIVWIAGGIDKGNNYAELEPVRGYIKSLICLGKDNEKLKKYYKSTIDKIFETDQLSEAVSQAYFQANKGDIVLLSPACASFDLFKNYEDRGDQFKAQVLALKKHIEDENAKTL